MKIKIIVAIMLLGAVLFILGAWNALHKNPSLEQIHHELITVTSPLWGDVVSNPLTVSGEARGYWFFEASFPLILTDWDGKIIAEGYATATEPWMTEEFVPFTGELTFTEPDDIGDFSDWGHLIFKKDNPSGLSEHDDAYEIRVRFR